MTGTIIFFFAFLFWECLGTETLGLNVNSWKYGIWTFFGIIIALLIGSIPHMLSLSPAEWNEILGR